MLIHIIYHMADLDGICSAAIVADYHRKDNTSIRLIPIDYGQPLKFDSINHGDVVYIVDFSLPRKQMLNLAGKCKLTWIDHHQSAIDEMEGCNFHGLQEVGKAACELCWEYFYSDTQMPTAVRLLGRYDVWDQSDEDLWNELIYPFQLGMRISGVHPTSSIWENLFSANPGQGNNPIVSDIVINGVVIRKYQAQQDEYNAGIYSFDIKFEGIRFVAMNASGGSIQFASVYNPDKHDAMLSFKYDKSGKWNISLRAIKDDVDILSIAKKYGGGGHKKACGFQTDTIYQIIPPAVSFRVADPLEDFSQTGVLPLVVSKTGKNDEPVTEVIICSSISGKAQYLNDMPKYLTLVRRLQDGTEITGHYAQ